MTTQFSDNSYQLIYEPETEIKVMLFEADHEQLFSELLRQGVKVLSESYSRFLGRRKFRHLQHRLDRYYAVRMVL